MLWDVRRAKGCLMTLDQHDEKSTSNKKKSGRSLKSYILQTTNPFFLSQF